MDEQFEGVDFLNAMDPFIGSFFLSLWNDRSKDPKSARIYKVISKTVIGKQWKKLFDKDNAFWRVPTPTSSDEEFTANQHEQPEQDNTISVNHQNLQTNLVTMNHNSENKEAELSEATADHNSVGDNSPATKHKDDIYDDYKFSTPRDSLSPINLLCKRKKVKARKSPMSAEIDKMAKALKKAKKGKKRFLTIFNPRNVPGLQQEESDSRIFVTPIHSNENLSRRGWGDGPSDRQGLRQMTYNAQMDYLQQAQNYSRNDDLDDDLSESQFRTIQPSSESSDVEEKTGDELEVIIEPEDELCVRSMKLKNLGNEGNEHNIGKHKSDEKVDVDQSIQQNEADGISGSGCLEVGAQPVVGTVEEKNKTFQTSSEPCFPKAGTSEKACKATTFIETFTFKINDTARVKVRVQDTYKFNATTSTDIESQTVGTTLRDVMTQTELEMQQTDIGVQVSTNYMDTQTQVSETRIVNDEHYEMDQDELKMQIDGNDESETDSINLDKFLDGVSLQFSDMDEDYPKTVIDEFVEEMDQIFQPYDESEIGGEEDQYEIFPDEELLSCHVQNLIAQNAHYTLAWIGSDVGGIQSDGEEEVKAKINIVSRTTSAPSLGNSVRPPLSRKKVKKSLVLDALL